MSTCVDTLCCLVFRKSRESKAHRQLVMTQVTILLSCFLSVGSNSLAIFVPQVSLIFTVAHVQSLHVIASCVVFLFCCVCLVMKS